jgi:UDP-glucose-4-epimerase GalE
MRKLLITGGAGYVGSHTVHHLLDMGYDPRGIVVFDNLVLGHREFLPPSVVFQEGDLLEKGQIEKVFREHRIHSVLHFAAYAYVGESMLNPGKYFENNVAGGINLLQSMVRHGCRRIVFSSSCATYGNQGPNRITESAPARPVNAYGESKRIFENILAWYHRIHTVSSVSLRYFNAAGADFGIGERHVPETHIIPLMIEAALGLRVFTVNGDDYNTPDGTCVRDYIHVTDLAIAHRKALGLLRQRGGCEIINLGSGKGCSVRQIADLLAEVTGSKIPIEVGRRRPGDAPVLIADSTRSRSMLDWKPERDIQEILQSAWTWHLQEIKQVQARCALC